MDAFVRTFDEPGKRTALLLVLCVLMVVYAEVGARLSPGDLGFSTIWPPCGLYYTALVFAPNLKRDWVGIFFAGALANFISDWIIHEATLVVTLSFIGSNTVSGMLAAFVARMSLSHTHSFNRPKGMLTYMACGLLIQSPIAATAGLWLQSIFWNNTFSWFKWIAWWSGNSLGITCFGPISLFILERFAMTIQHKKKEIHQRKFLSGDRFRAQIKS